MEKVGYECRVMGVPKQLTMICLEPIIAPVMAAQQSLSQHHAWKSARIPTFIIRIWSLSLK